MNPGSTAPKATCNATSNDACAPAADGHPDWPSHGLQEDVRPWVETAFANGRPCVLATLVRVDGPSPRPVGAQMAITSATEFCGYVSGGCVESVIAAEAGAVLRSGAPCLLVYGRGSPFCDVRLPCGGRIEVALERVDPGDSAALAWLAARGRRQPVTWLASLTASEHACRREGDASVLSAQLAAAASAAQAGGARAAGVEPAAHAIWRRADPPTRLVVTGGDAVALALCALGETAGFEVILNRPNGPVAPPAGFQGRYVRSAPTALFNTLRMDRYTAVVTTSHEADVDHEVLCGTLSGPAFYVGVLGSRSRIEERRERLLAAGLEPDRVDRLKAPVGLDIGAVTAFEIAVSIMAEIIATRNAAAGPGS